MRLYMAGLAVLMSAAAFFLAGCNGAGGSDVAKARLVAVENRKLTQQIQEKDQRIAQLEAELAQVKAESQAQLEQVNKATNEILGPLMLQVQELKAENERLKKELEQLSGDRQQ